MLLRLTLFFVLVINVRATAQHLDSLFTFQMNEAGDRQLSAKSFWEFDLANNEHHSSYYIFDRNHSGFVHINDQWIKYHGTSRKHEFLRTIDYKLNKIDSIVSLFNEDQICIEKRRYSKSREGESPYILKRIDSYEGLDHTHRMTREIKKRPSNNELITVSEYHYEYKYDDQNQLIDKKAFLINKDKLVPKYQLIQTYTDEGEIASVSRYNFDLKSGEYVLSYTATYQYFGQERIETRTNFTFNEKDPSRIQIQQITYLNDSEEILRKAFYTKSLAAENLYREDIYYYSE